MQRAATGGTLAANVMHFARLLRRAGLPVGAGRDDRGASERWPWSISATARQVRAALRAVMVHRHEHADVFDQAFALFWRDPAAGRSRPRRWRCSDEQAPREAAEARRPAAAGVAEAMAAAARAAPQTEEQPPELDARHDRQRARAAAGDGFRGDERRARSPTPRPRSAASRCRSTCAAPAGCGPTRAARASTSRATMRAQPAPRRRDHSRSPARRRVVRPPPLVVLCDISGSMARYAQILLHFLHAVANDRDRVTCSCSAPGCPTSPASCATATPRSRSRWSPTPCRTGPAAPASARRSPSSTAAGRKRVLGQGAVVLLVTDGLDRDGARGARREHGPAAPLLPPADLAQPAVALGRVPTQIPGHPRHAAARGRVPDRAQPRQPARAGRTAVPPGPVARRADAWRNAA